MAPIPEDDDWSDSDEEALSDVETSVTLGVPDGPLKSEGDVIDAAVSRIGGLPAFLVTPEPSLSSSYCKICAKPMELLVQMWCPLEDSPMDRALYVWGCAASTCQKKDGSIRAWRGLRFNTEYAAKLEEKLAKKKAKAQEKKTPLANPFSMGGSPVTPNPFSLGTQVFGSVPQPVVGDSRDEEHENESDAESDTSEHSLITALTSTKLEDSPWNSTPHYPPQYLSTVPEYIAPERKRKVPSGADVLDATDDVKNDKSAPWNSETYENSLDIDQVFERFSKRVEYEPEQCVRYELNGTPLPFARGAVYDSLFPPPPPENLPVTKPDFKVVRPVKRVYSASCIPSCPSCRSHRVFECQLMPNLINILRDTSVEANKKLSDEERRKIVEQELKGGAQVRGMEWGTAIVFSCEKDCVQDGAREAWREEHVLIQWDE